MRSDFVEMWRYTICITFLAGVISVYGQTTAPKICWDSTWYNNFAPTATNRSDYENQPAVVMSSICPCGKVVAAQCRDQKGEPFTGVKNDSANQYIATCNIVTGLICNPYNNSKAICSDFEIQYGCACSLLTTSSGGCTTDASQRPERNGGQQLLFSAGVLCFAVDAIVYLLF